MNQNKGSKKTIVMVDRSPNRGHNLLREEEKNCARAARNFVEQMDSSHLSPEEISKVPYQEIHDKLMELAFLLEKDIKRHEKTKR